MMLLSRFWYVVLSIFVGVALYAVYVAVGQYNRRNAVAMNEGLASDSQTVGWALQIDARRRLDLLLPGSVDPAVRSGLAGANGKDKIPQKSRDDTRKALAEIQSKIADYKPDAIFAVDRDGRLVAQVGYESVSSNDEFELGGYPAVFDALHGYLRDDTWVWGGRLYRVVTRPVEEDATQPPVGAIVAVRAIDAQFAKDLAKRTRTNVSFYTSAQKVAAAAYDGANEKLDEASFELLTMDMPRLAEDKAYKDSGRSEVHPLGQDAYGAMYARLPGDAWDLGAGFAVLRPRVSIKGPMGFLSGADDTDKKSVSWLVIVAAVFFSALFGLVFSLLEHTLPLREFSGQAGRLKRGEQDYFQLPKIRGGLRDIAQEINGGIERIAERGGAAVRKPADLESILGPVPAQPAMSAFSFPMAGGGAGGEAAAVPPVPPAAGAPPGPQAPPAFRPPHMPPPAAPGLAPPSRPGPPPVPPHSGPGSAGQLSAPRTMGGPTPPTNPGNQFPLVARPAAGAPRFPPFPDAPPAPGSGPAAMENGASDEDEATMVGQVPADVLAAATGESKGAAGTEEWLGVYDDFIRKKRECGEPTDGLTFEKFAQTLKKNRDALMQRHGCKRVRFAVYVKEGRASLKATPIKD